MVSSQPKPKALVAGKIASRSLAAIPNLNFYGELIMCNWLNSEDSVFKTQIGPHRNLSPPLVRNEAFGCSIGSLLSSLGGFPHFIQLLGSNASVDGGRNECGPRGPTYRILYAIMAVIVGLSLSFRLIVLGKNWLDPDWLNLPILLLSFVLCAYGFA